MESAEGRIRPSADCGRRVIGKAETGAQGDNPRFIVTNIPLEGLLDADGEPLIQTDGQSLSPPERHHRSLATTLGGVPGVPGAARGIELRHDHDSQV